MKKLILGLIISSCIVNVSAQESELFLHNIEPDYQETTNNILDHMYVGVELHVPIIPNDISAVVGYDINNGSAEVELYVSARVSRFFTDEHDLHLPVGARIRISLNKSRTLYVEYQREFKVLNNNEYGLLETPNLISVVKHIKGSNLLVGCGIGNSKHHAWRDEDHEVESGGYFECRIQKRF